MRLADLWDFQACDTLSDRLRLRLFVCHDDVMFEEIAVEVIFLGVVCVRSHVREGKVVGTI
jgi:hypothetical protein